MLEACGPFEVFSVATRVAARDRAGRPAPFAGATVAVGPDRTVRARGGLPLVADVLLADGLAAGTTFDLVVVPGGVTTAIDDDRDGRTGRHRPADGFPLDPA